MWETATDALAMVVLALRADVNLFEIGLLVLTAVGVRRGWLRTHGRFPRLEAWGRRLAQRKRTAVLAVILLAIGLRLALIPLVPVPHPTGSDEYGHLLLGDTLAQGRLANPAHPLWTHFESRHILQQPTYSSMYFPAQGLFLAFGQRVFSHPWAGVLISTALLCGAITWMLQGWFPPGWALLGGWLAVLRLGLTSYWINGYFGGSVTALGGALVLGAYPRLRRRLRTGDAVWMALGLVLMAASRPFEGLAFALPVAAAMGAWLLSGARPAWRAAVARLILPVLLVLGLAGAGLATYFHAVTGSPATVPYQINQRTYGWPMTLLWQDPPRVEHRHRELRAYYEWELAEHERLRRPVPALLAVMYKGVLLWCFYLGPALSLPLLVAPAWLRSRRLRVVFLAGAATLAATLAEQSSYPHYISPATCVFYAAIILTMNLLTRKTQPLSKVVAAVPAILILAVVFRLAAMPLGVPLVGPQRHLSWCCAGDFPNCRWPFEQRLRATPGRHLVIVRYSASRQNNVEWVYNEASIDAAKVVWARDMGEEANRQLIRYYPDRRVWLAEPDATPAQLIPY